MDGFDMLSMGLGMIDPNNPITELNSKLHQSDLYNGFQMGVSMVSSFTGAASQNMACFIAGTMVLTTAGLVAIEEIKAGDIVISTNPETLETDEKPVLETYIRQVDKLVHLTINGGEIVTTIDHPFYVRYRGFVNAVELKIGDELLDSDGNVMVLENRSVELTDESTTVYNFQVEDFHTYFVGQSTVWVHNANCNIDDNVEAMREKYPVNANGYFGEKGKNTRVIRSDNPESTSIDFYERIGKNGKVEQLSNGHGTKTVLDDGSSIVHRLVTSTKDSPAVSITVTNSKTVKNQKIHFIK